MSRDRDPSPPAHCNRAPKFGLRERVLRYDEMPLGFVDLLAASCRRFVFDITDPNSELVEIIDVPPRADGGAAT